MFKAVDPYTYTLTGQLQDGGQAVGLFAASYQVTRYDDVQLSSGTVQAGVPNPGVRKYVLSVTQRVMIYNPSGLVLSPQTDVTAYPDYPALINMQLTASAAEDMTFQLIGYSPQTVNTQVQTAGTTGNSTGQTQGNSISRTAGSSTAQANTYGVSVGSMGDAFNFGLSAETSTTTTTEHSRTSTSESGTSRNQEASSSADMSIKDWGAYALVNPQNNCPAWTFGQEYPWDAIECRKTTEAPNPHNPAQVQLVVPSAMTVRLYDGVSLYPPSHLSMFGINFSAHAQWIVTVDDSESDQVSLSHVLEYFTASHSLTGPNSSVAVYLDSTPTKLFLPGADDISTTLDLGVLSLDPVGQAEAPAVVGFIPSKFTVLPVPAGDGAPPKQFSILANANTLLVRDTTSYPASCSAGAGFGAGETALTATLTGNCTSLTYAVLLKVVDAAADYTLHLKHWKTTPVGVMLTIVVNGDPSTTLTKYVDAAEAEGGESNILSVALRKQDFASVDYSDVLTMGLNSIAVTVTPIDGSATAGYALRAVSVEPS